ncbi:hypothetical protein LXL04_005723 [Taraxacum kok-saghyz]
MQVRFRSDESRNQTFLEHADQSPYQIPTHFIDKREEDEMNNAEANKYLNLHTPSPSFFAFSYVENPTPKTSHLMLRNGHKTIEQSKGILHTDTFDSSSENDDMFVTMMYGYYMDELEDEEVLRTRVAVINKNCAVAHQGYPGVVSRLGERRIRGQEERRLLPWNTAPHPAFPSSRSATAS